MSGFRCRGQNCSISKTFNNSCESLDTEKLAGFLYWFAIRDPQIYFVKLRTDLPHHLSWFGNIHIKPWWRRLQIAWSDKCYIKWHSQACEHILTLRQEARLSKHVFVIWTIKTASSKNSSILTDRLDRINNAACFLWLLNPSPSIPAALGKAATISFSIKISRLKFIVHCGFQNHILPARPFCKPPHIQANVRSSIPEQKSQAHQSAFRNSTFQILGASLLRHIPRLQRKLSCNWWMCLSVLRILW